MCDSPSRPITFGGLCISKQFIIYPHNAILQCRTWGKYKSWLSAVFCIRMIRFINNNNTNTSPISLCSLISNVLDPTTHNRRDQIGKAVVFRWLWAFKQDIIVFVDRPLSIKVCTVVIKCQGSITNYSLSLESSS